MQFDEIIGAKRDKEISYIRVEMTNRNVIDGYPITKTKYEDLSK